MKQVRLIAREDVDVARMPPALHRGRRTKGHVEAPIEDVVTTPTERRHCRSCGFPLGVGELVRTFHYGWSDDSDYDSAVAAAIHLAACRHGAAHDLVTTGRLYPTTSADLDEVEATLFAMYAQGLSDARIARTIGTTPGSVNRVLRRIARRVRLTGDRHARAIAEALLQGADRDEQRSVDADVSALIEDLSR